MESFSQVMPGGGRAEVKGATRAARHVGRLRLALEVVVHQVEAHLALLFRMWPLVICTHHEHASGKEQPASDARQAMLFPTDLAVPSWKIVNATSRLP